MFVSPNVNVVLLVSPDSMDRLLNPDGRGLGERLMATARDRSARWRVARTIVP